MAKQGCAEEARFIEAVSNYHKAADGRGLIKAQEKQYNLHMLNYILEGWIPWCAHQEQHGYSTMNIYIHTLFDYFFRFYKADSQ